MADPARRPRQAPPFRLIVGGIIAVLVVWFALVNRDPVPISFIFFEREPRLIYIILGSAILGAIAGALLRRHRERERRERRSND